MRLLQEGDVILISSGVLFITTHHHSRVCQMRRPTRICEIWRRGGIEQQSHNSFAAGNLCSTIQGFLSITICCLKDLAPLCDDFPPLLRRCCAYLKPSLLVSCRAATAHLSLRHGSQSTQQQWVGDVLESGSRVTHRDYHTRAHPAFVASHIEKVRCPVPRTGGGGGGRGCGGVDTPPWR
jgi:hypothetical protein